MNRPFAPGQLLFKDYKDALLEYDFGFFFDKEAKGNGYSDKNLQEVHLVYKKALDELEKQASKKPKQFRLYLEGQVHLMFSGGLLPSLFGLDGVTVKQSVLDFKGLAEDWAYFEAWQKMERKHQRKKKVWDIVVKVGAVLAYVLSLIKLLELIFKA